MIAFVSDRDGADNLWVAGADGSAPRPLTKDKQSLFASPSWTPDGEYVLVSRQPQLPVGGLRALDVPRPRRLGRAGHQGEDQARLQARRLRPRHRRRRLARTASIFTTPSETSCSTLTTISTFPLSQVDAARPGDRRRRHDHRRPRQRVSARRSRPMERSWSMAPGSTTRPGCGSATWPAARSAGSSCPFSATSKSRGTPAT